MTKRIAQVFGITVDELLSEGNIESGSENDRFPYPAKILALEKQQAQGKKLRELIQATAAICVGVDFLTMGAYDMQVPPWIRGLVTCIEVMLFGAYLMVRASGTALPSAYGLPGDIEPVGQLLLGEAVFLALYFNVLVPCHIRSPPLECFSGMHFFWNALLPFVL